MGGPRVKDREEEEGRAEADEVGEKGGSERGMEGRRQGGRGRGQAEADVGESARHSVTGGWLEDREGERGGGKE